VTKHFLTIAILNVAGICYGQPGTIKTVAGAGGGVSSGDGGAAINAAIPSLRAIAFDSAGNYYVGDGGRIRKVNTSGIISTFAGDGTAVYSGDGGPAISAGLVATSPASLAVDTSGNLYLLDVGRVRKVDTSGTITTVAGNGGNGYGGDGGPATGATIATTGVAVDTAGNLYLADNLNNRVRKVDHATGVISTIAGNGNNLQQGNPAGDGSAATSVAIENPLAVAVDSAGIVYFSGGSRIYKIDSSGILHTVAGTGTRGYSGDTGPAISAKLFAALALTLDSAGNLYFADPTNLRLRKVDTSGIMTTVAGNGTSGFSGDGGPAIAAQLQNIQGVAVDGAGNIYFDDIAHVREVIAPVSSTAPSLASATNAFDAPKPIAPNTWVAVKGINLAPAGDTRIWGNADFTNNQLPAALDGVSVTVNGKNAFVYYISPTQLNILTPPDALPTSVPVQVTVRGVASNVINAQAQPISPAFFTFDGTNVTGTHLDGSLLGPTTLYPGLSTPAMPGETVILYGNGFGPTSATVVLGSVSQSGTLPTMPIIGVQGSSAPAQVTFAGLVAPGLFQFNVVVPPTALDGNDLMQAGYGGITTSPVVLAVHH
jgi:uncharacterized protein (TIGR03437 family)